MTERAFVRYAVCRVGIDVASQFPGCPSNTLPVQSLPTPLPPGAPNVTVNGFAVHLRGQMWMQHCCSWGNCYTATTTTGAPTTTINGVPVARVGDVVQRTRKDSGNLPPRLGATVNILTGSMDTFVYNGTGSGGSGSGGGGNGRLPFRAGENLAQ